MKYDNEMLRDPLLRAFAAAMGTELPLEDDKPAIGGPQTVDEAVEAGYRMWHVHIERKADAGVSCLNVVAKTEADARQLMLDCYVLSSQFEADKPIEVTKCDDETEDDDWRFTLNMRAVKTLTAELLDYERARKEAVVKEPLTLPAIGTVL